MGILEGVGVLVPDSSVDSIVGLIEGTLDRSEPLSSCVKRVISVV